jgi:hypothetical protein
LLGYYSTDMRRDRLFRRVLVKLVKVRGAQVRFRSGTYAPGPIPAH